MSYFPGVFCQWCSRSRLPSSCARKPPREKGHVSPWAWVVRGLAAPGFLPCSSQSCLVTRTPMKSLGHLGSPMPSQGCAFTAGFSLLGRFTFCLACWVSWHHLVRSSVTDRVKHSCIVPEKRLCHRFLPTPPPPAVPRFPRLIASGVWLFVGSECSCKMPNLWFSCCNLASLLLVLSFLEMSKSCFSALLLPFPYLKVIIFSHQSSLNLNKPNSFPGMSCFLDLITFFLWILSSGSFLKP